MTTRRHLPSHTGHGVLAHITLVITQIDNGRHTAAQGYIISLMNAIEVERSLKRSRKFFVPKGLFQTHPPHLGTYLLDSGYAAGLIARLAQQAVGGTA